MSESKSSTTAAKPEPRLVAESIEFLGTHRAEIGFGSEAGEITSDTAFDAAHRFNTHAALVEALEPFANFFEKFSAKPMMGIGDEFYGIHTGTEWAASLRISDMKRAAEALAAAKVTK